MNPRYDVDKVHRFRGTEEMAKPDWTANMHISHSLQVETLLYEYLDTANPLVADALCFGGDPVRLREDCQ